MMLGLSFKDFCKSLLVQVSITGGVLWISIQPAGGVGRMPSAHELAEIKRIRRMSFILLQLGFLLLSTNL